MLKKYLAALTALFLFCSVLPALAETAEDITQECLLNGLLTHAKVNAVRDGKYSSVWKPVREDGVCSLGIEAPQGKTVGGILIRWGQDPVPVAVQVQKEDGSWETVASCGGDFPAQYLEIPSLAAFRIVNAENDWESLSIAELTILTPGTLPADVQVWEKAGDKVDLMLFAAHPDDEVLWFGGLLPTYGGELGKRVLVLNASNCNNVRKLELLDCVWACGIRICPEFLGKKDVCTKDLDTLYHAWGKEATQQKVVEIIRAHRPDVLVLHAESGEYGHAVHRAASELGRKGAEFAADPSYRTESGENEPWQVKKVYVHLSQENPAEMDWKTPLSAFGGKTGLEAASEAYLFHRSQIHKKWTVDDGGKYDNAAFGLVFSAVGFDECDNDLFQHLD